MRKIYKLKDWYTLEEAATRLTLTLGEPFTVNDVLQMTVEGHLPLSWYMRYVYAQQVAPCTYLFHDLPPKMLEKLPPMPKLHSESLAAVSGIHQLEGAHTLDLEMCGAIKDWVISLMTDTGGELVSLDGYFVRDGEGNIWRIMDMFTRADREAYGKKMDTSKSMMHPDNFYPSGGSPDPEDLGITAKDLEAFETLLNTQSSQPEKALSSRERTTALKLIIGMAVKGYSYNPNTSRSPTAQEISDDLAMLGISVDPDTVRKWLREAAELLPVEVA
jgi:hypothetical protein